MYSTLTSLPSNIGGIYNPNLFLSIISYIMIDSDLIGKREHKGTYRGLFEFTGVRASKEIQDFHGQHTYLRLYPPS